MLRFSARPSLAPQPACSSPAPHSSSPRSLPAPRTVRIPDSIRHSSRDAASAALER
ncbi:hypothetical protein B0H14DRAFT_3440961 [Mycena olivaceomarginata]|nr:hypothetical protein B0H14DRAFT_3440961 [Mycena olivaceomarginata]